MGLDRKHLFIAVVNSKGEVTTKGLYPKGGVLAGAITLISGAAVEAHVVTNISGEKDGAEGVLSGERSDSIKLEATISPPDGISEAQYDQMVLEAADNYSQEAQDTYSVYGPNSNTFVDNVIEYTGERMTRYRWGVSTKLWGGRRMVMRSIDVIFRVLYYIIAILIVYLMIINPFLTENWIFALKVSSVYFGLLLGVPFLLLNLYGVYRFVEKQILFIIVAILSAGWVLWSMIQTGGKLITP